MLYKSHMSLALICISLTCVLLFGGCANSTEIIAHRGASHIAPENTRAAELLAWEKSADSVEIDVHISADGRVMVIHDSDTKRTTGVKLKVSETSSQELRKLDAGSFKGKQYAGENIPYLEEIIKAINDSGKLYIEIKCGKHAVEPIAKIVEESGKINQIVIISFDFDTVVLSKQIMPKVPAYWVIGTRKDKKTKQWIEHDVAWIKQAQDHGVDGLDVHFAGISEKFMAAVKQAGQELYVWTVDDPAEAKRLIDLGVAGITTNRPGWLQDQIMSRE